MQMLGVIGVCRWLAIGKNSATSAPAAAQPAGQQSQTEAASKAADPSRWLSKGAMDTLRWQVRAALTAVRACLNFGGQQAHESSCNDWPGGLEGGSADRLRMYLGGRHCLQASVAADLSLQMRSE